MRPVLILQDETPFAVHEQPLGSYAPYVRTLTQRYAGSVETSTGAGRIFHDLMTHLPALPSYEAERAELGHDIADLVYPLAANLEAQAVAMSLRIAPVPLAPPVAVTALSVYVAFDIDRGRCLSCFLAPDHAIPGTDRLGIAAGLTVLCEPLNYHYHRLHDDRRMRPRHATANLPSRVNRNVDRLNAYDEWPTPSPPHPQPGFGVSAGALLAALAVAREITPHVAGPHGTALTGVPYIKGPDIVPTPAPHAAPRQQPPAASLQRRHRLDAMPSPEPFNRT